MKTPYRVSYGNYLKHSYKCGVGFGGGGEPDPEPPSGMLLWLNSDDIPGANGAAISSWPDSSGNGLNATGVGATRPLKQTVGVGGQPSAVFDDTKILSLPSGFADFSAGSHFVFVLRPVTGGGASFPTFMTLSPGGSALEVLFYSNALNVFMEEPGHQIGNGAYFFDADTYLEFETVAGAANTPVAGLCRVNGVAGSAGTFNNEVGARTGSTIGAFDGSLLEPFFGLIAEIIIYNRALTPAEKTQLNDYIAFKFGLP
jgi:hypothetical protein